MKIRLEKPAVNIWKFTGGKNEKARQWALHKKLQLDLYFVYKKYYMEIKITEYVVCQQEAFYIIEILLLQTEVISGFLFTFVTHKLWEHLVESFYCFLIHIQSPF